MAKKQNKTPSTRNPMAALVRDPMFRKRIAKSDSERADQRDQWSKKAKHKKVQIDEGELAIEGDALFFGDEHVCDFRMEKRPGRTHLGESLIMETGRVILKMANVEKTFSGWDEAKGFVAAQWSPQAQVDALLDEVNAARHEAQQNIATYFEDFQWGDKVKVKSGPLKNVLDKAEELRKKKQSDDDEEPAKKQKPHDEGVVKEPDGPANTVGITVDGQYHIVDEENLELIFEGFDAAHATIEEDYDDLLEFRFIETTAGIRVPISQEEQEILDMCKEKMYKSSLDERNQEVARKMVSRGVLNRRKDDTGRLYFVPNTQKLTRF